jgi:hypothetical protein
LKQAIPKSHEMRESCARLAPFYFFSTTSNMLFVREESGWKALGHVIPLDAPMMNKPIYQRREDEVPTELEKSFARLNPSTRQLLPL